MSKRNQIFPSYEYLDSQRLKDTFFSPQKKKKFPKRLFLFSATAVILIGALIFLLNYDLIIIARQNIKLRGTSVSLLKNKNISSVRFIEGTNQLIGKKLSFIHLPIIFPEKTGIRINLEKPINLNNTTLRLYLKKSSASLNVAMVLKDIFYRSNSLNPLFVTAKETKTLPIKVPIELENTLLQNINLSKINQITIYFYPQNKEKQNWVLIKDLISVKANGKI